MRVAWFSPLPPVRSGIAACSADLIPALATRHAIDVYVDEPLAGIPGARSAHEFLWRHRQQPYDLTVYQIGNSSHHDYLWPYLFRVPGLAVLHDVHLHHARAAALLRTRRDADYRAEFAACHPDAADGTAELAVAGFDSHLYYMWPMTRLVVDASKLTAVHSRPLAARLRAERPDAAIEHIRLSQGTLVTPAREAEARRAVRARYGIPADAVTFGCFGGLTPEKRVPQILDAFAALLPYAPDARLLLAGAAPAHYHLDADVRLRDLGTRAVRTDYLETDDELTDAIAAVDVTLNLRWPTARETSGPWLRALAAGKPSIVIDLLQTTDVPAVDPRTWARPHTGEDPVAVAIDILDEGHSLRLAMRRLAGDTDLRRTLGEAARKHWIRDHAPEAMAADYERLMAAAHARPAPAVMLPPHLADRGMRRLDALLEPFGLPSPVR